MLYSFWTKSSARLCTHSQCPLPVFASVWVPRATSIFKLWSNQSKIGFLFYVLKLVETLRPIKGFLTFYWLPKGKWKLFLPHPLHAMLCRCSSFLFKITNTLFLNGGEGEGWIPLFSVVTLFEYNVSTILSPIFAYITVPHVRYWPLQKIP